MKNLLSLPMLITAVTAQGNLNGCGQMCWNNMVGQASSLGCSSGEIQCLCGKPNFQYGLNDCSRQACGDAVHAAVVAYGRSQCGNQGAAQGGTSPGGMTTTGPPPATTTETTAPSESTSESTVTAGVHNSTTTTAHSETSSTTLRTVSGTSTTAGATSPVTSTNLAMKIAGPFAGAGALGLAAIFLPMI